MSQKQRDGLPGFSPREASETCIFQVNHEMLASYLPCAGDLSLRPERGSVTGLSSLGGEGGIVTGVPGKEKLKDTELLLKYAKHRTNSAPRNHKTKQKLFAENLDGVRLR